MGLTPTGTYVVNDPDDPDAIPAVVVDPAAWRLRTIAAWALVAGLAATAIVDWWTIGPIVTCVDVAFLVAVVVILLTTR